MSKAIDLHIKHNYFIKIQKLKNVNGCQIDIPANRIDGTPEKSMKYIINNSKLEVYYNGQKTPKWSTSEPIYALRIFVVADIFLNFYQYNIANELVIYYNELGERYVSNIIKMIDPPFSDEKNNEREKKLDGQLMRIFSEGDPLPSEEEELREQGIYEGFKCLLKLINNGEL